MKKSYEQMARESIEEISRNILGNIAELRQLTENSEITIGRLESLMGKLKTENNKAISKLYNDYIKTIPEKDLIRKKKPNYALKA
ncbi:MAG: hypothetical protein LBK05_08765 [Treponema sp.]|jgi:hypothetical protein|nr:hypothetical protein [Treponema sp.]